MKITKWISLEIPEKIAIKIDVPALDAYVKYLQDKDQAKIDALAAQVQQLSDALAQSSGALKDVVKSTEEGG